MHKFHIILFKIANVDKKWSHKGPNYISMITMGTINVFSLALLQNQIWRKKYQIVHNQYLFEHEFLGCHHTPSSSINTVLIQILETIKIIKPTVSNGKKTAYKSTLEVVDSTMKSSLNLQPKIYDPPLI